MAREALTIMALRKEEFHDDDEQQEANTMKRSRITIDISPELRRRIKVAASQRDASISEYLGRILEENVPEEMNLVEQEAHPVPSDILEEVDRIRERVIRESKGHIFEDSAEVLRQQREERTQYLEDLRDQS
jgi:hypothetical protein